MKNNLILTCDIGGTKTNFGIFSSDASTNFHLKLNNDTFKTFLNSNYSDPQASLREYLSTVQFKVNKAVIAVAGPVTGGKAKITNLPWVIKKEQLKKVLNISQILLINDLEAIAYGALLLKSGEKHTINDGKPVSNATIAVIAPGTGLGESFLTWNGSRYLAHASEGGHGDFAPTNALEIELLNYLLDKFDHVSYERVCSGTGLQNIYEYLKMTGKVKEPSWLAEQLATAKDPTKLIINASLDRKNPCKICNMTVNMFVNILGAEAGNLALKTMAKGGIYLGGGIPLRILSILDHEQFMKSFRNKGRMSKMLENIPVHLILNTKVSLFGAAYYGLIAT